MHNLAGYRDQSRITIYQRYGIHKGIVTGSEDIWRYECIFSPWVAINLVKIEDQVESVAEILNVNKLKLTAYNMGAP